MNGLNISQIFFQSLQGEGINIGKSCVFLRLQGCILNCTWCDTWKIWRKGSFFTFPELFKILEEQDLIKEFKNGVHLVLTGGSPLMQQANIINFLNQFCREYKFLPYIEIENEGVIPPHPVIESYISCWNNSPKLKNSNNLKTLRYKPDVLKTLSSYDNSWFKFVISEDSDWDEIEVDFLFSGLIRKNQIILMPQAASKKELLNKIKKIEKLAQQKGVRFSNRLHVELGIK